MNVDTLHKEDTEDNNNNNNNNNNKQNCPKGQADPDNQRPD